MAKPKYRSRARRASDTAADWRSIAEDLTGLRDDNDPEDVDPLLQDTFIKDVVKDAQGILEKFSTGEVDSLLDEMSAWRDSVPDNLQGGDKYSAIDEACNTLEDPQGRDVGTIEVLDDITSVVDELESMADDLEQVEFPGMFG